jgi:hypothetical protein
MGDPHVKVKLRGRHNFCLSFPFSDRAVTQSNDILARISMPPDIPVAQPTITQNGQGDGGEHEAPLTAPTGDESTAEVEATEVVPKRAVNAPRCC